MTKTVFQHGTIPTPEFFNAINNLTFSADPQVDGEILLPPQIAAEAQRAMEAEQALETAIAAYHGFPAILSVSLKYLGENTADIIDPSTVRAFGLVTPSVIIFNLQISVSLSSSLKTYWASHDLSQRDAYIGLDAAGVFPHTAGSPGFIIGTAVVPAKSINGAVIGVPASDLTSPSIYLLSPGKIVSSWADVLNSDYEADIVLSFTYPASAG